MKPDTEKAIRTAFWLVVYWLALGMFVHSLKQAQWHPPKLRMTGSPLSQCPARGRAPLTFARETHRGAQACSVPRQGGLRAFR